MSEINQAKNDFIQFWIIGYAKNSSHGRNPVRVSSISVHYPRTPNGLWRKLFWRFYYRVTKVGYLEEKEAMSE